MTKTIEQMVEDLLLEKPFLTLEEAREIVQQNNQELVIKEMIDEKSNTTDVKSLKEEIYSAMK